MINEAAIRNFIASNLSIVENGLSFIASEKAVKNPFGTSGRIDILARDSIGQHVIIEIKKSNKTARETIHELHKYAALLQIDMGIPAETIRCIVISTHWAELLVPYSEFYRSSTYPINGYKIIFSKAGIYVNIKPVFPLPKSEERTLCPEHIIYFFSKKSVCAKSFKAISKKLDDLGINDYCITDLVHDDSNPNVIYPFGLYIVLDAFSIEERMKFAERMDIRLDDYDLEESPWIVESLVLGQIGTKSFPYETCEIGYPEKFQDILKNWQIIKIHRKGRFERAVDLISDSELIFLIAGFDGSNAFFYHSLSNTKFKSNWNRSVEKANYTLMGNKDWISAFEWFSNHLSSYESNSVVSISIFNPLNILLSIYKAAKENDLTYFPSMEIVCQSSDPTTILVLSSFLNWDGTKPTDPEIIINKYFKDIFNFFIVSNHGGMIDYDSLIKAEIGLRYETNLYLWQNGKKVKLKKIQVIDSKVELLRVGSFEKPNVVNFLKENDKFVTKLVKFIGANMCEI